MTSDCWAAARLKLTNTRATKIWAEIIITTGEFFIWIKHVPPLNYPPPAKSLNFVGNWRQGVEYESRTHLKYGMYTSHQKLSLNWVDPPINLQA